MMNGVIEGVMNGVVTSYRAARDLICCSERGGAAFRRRDMLPLEGAETPLPRSRRFRKLEKKFDTDSGTTLVIEYASEGSHADAFDRAFETNDLRALVELLSSSQPIDEIGEPKHPWAEDPKTVGTLVAMYLARLASEVGKSDRSQQRIKDEIREAGAIPPLVDFIRGKQEDHIQTAVVTLRYLTDECAANATTVYKEGAMPMLISCLRSPVGGLRGAAASTLRNIYLGSDEYRKAFVDLGGVEGLVMHLDSPSVPSLSHADVQFEAVCNLEDLIEDHDGNLIPEYAECAANFGAKEKLERLRDSEDEDVKISAEKVWSQLQLVSAR